MAEDSQFLTDAVKDNTENFYGTLEEYVQQVRLRYNLPVRPKFPRTSALGKNRHKNYFEVK